MLFIPPVFASWLVGVLCFIFCVFGSGMYRKTQESMHFTSHPPDTERWFFSFFFDFLFSFLHRRSLAAETDRIISSQYNAFIRSHSISNLVPSQSKLSGLCFPICNNILNSDKFLMLVQSLCSMSTIYVNSATFPKLVVQSSCRVLLSGISMIIATFLFFHSNCEISPCFSHVRYVAVLTVSFSKLYRNRRYRVFLVCHCLSVQLIHNK